MSKIKIQLFVNPSSERVSMKFHIFVDNRSICKRFSQDTDFFETDLVENISNYRTISDKDFKKILLDNKHVICSKCLQQCLNIIKKTELQNDELVK